MSPNENVFIFFIPVPSVPVHAACPQVAANRNHISVNFMPCATYIVIPAKAGICFLPLKIPAFAGMTVYQTRQRSCISCTFYESFKMFVVPDRFDLTVDTIFIIKTVICQEHFKI
jgi:hypothetical protein